MKRWERKVGINNRERAGVEDPEPAEGAGVEDPELVEGG